MLRHGKHTVAVGEVELSIEIGGDGPPLLFTTPGWGASIEGYRHLRPLEQRFTVIWAETRGTGASSAPSDGDYRLPRFTEDAEALRVALGIEQWWVAGHSTGGVLAQHYVTHHTDRCLGTILLCSYLPLEPGRLDDIIARGTARAGEPGCDDALAAFPVPATTDEEATKKIGDILPLYFCEPAAAERFKQECAGMSCRAAAMVAEDPGNLDRSAVGLLPTLDVPAVIVAASDDFVCSPPWNQQIHHLIPGSKFVLVENAGHFPWFENPMQFWSGLDDALSALRSSGPMASTAVADLLTQPGTPADGWEANADHIDARLRLVTDWLLERSDVGAGDIVLEIAAGPGGVGHGAAERVGPQGRVLVTDIAQAMVDVARRIGTQRGLTNVEYRVMDAQAMDLDDDAVDAVVCRSGFMLMPDPAAALREVRRVLRPGGNLAFSVFAAPARNPFVGVPLRVLEELGHVPPPPRGTPGVFALSDPERVRDVLIEAEFTVEAVEAIDVEGPYPSADSIVDRIFEMNARIGPIQSSLSEPQRAALRQALLDGFDAFRRNDGTFLLPAQMWGAHAR